MKAVPVIETFAHALELIIEGRCTRESLMRLGIAREVVDNLLNETSVEANPLRRLSMAVNLLAEVNPPSAVALGGRLFVESEERLVRANDKERRKLLVDFQRSLLLSLGQRQDRRVVSVILRRLPEMAPYDRSYYYDYLVQSSYADQWVHDRLKRMIEDKDSPLYNDISAISIVVKMRLRESVDQLSLRLEYRNQGPEEKKAGLPSLILCVGKCEDDLPGEYLRARISREEAEKIIDRLHYTGFFYRAAIHSEHPAAVPEGNWYLLTVQGGPDASYRELLPFGAGLLRYLEEFQALTEGEAAGALGTLRKRLEAAGVEADGKVRDRATLLAVKALKENLDEFRLRLEYQYQGPDETKGEFRSLMLSVPEFPNAPGNEYLGVRISQAQAEKLIDYLADTGFLLRGTFNREKGVRAPEGHSYRLDVSAADKRYYESMPFNPVLLQRLKALQEVAGGEGARALGKLIDEVEAAGIKLPE